MRRAFLAAALALALSAPVACDRNLEPFDPDEKPQQPDLQAIFPAGAQRSAESQAALPSAPGRSSRRAAAPVGASAEPIEGTIELAPELAGRVPEGAVVFLIARHGESGPPLAVQRFASPSFPLQFRIGPEDGMGRSLPFAGPVHFTVWVDADGIVNTRVPGDLQGSSESGYDPGARGVSVVIDEAL